MAMKSTVLFKDPEVFLTVSSVAGTAKFGKHAKNIDRRLELNWNNFEYRPGDFVCLFDFDIEEYSRENRSSNLPDLARELIEVSSGHQGYYRSSVRYEKRALSVKGNRQMGFWIAYIRNENGTAWKVLKSNSLRIFPLWMNELKDIIGDIPLHSLMIPGTHDAGSWMEYDVSRCENIYVRYYICQEDSVYEQLVHGIRYVDVRVAYYPDLDEKFWVNHHKYKVTPLITLISDVRRFVTETKEIIFLDFHGFPIGFSSPSVHQELYRFVLNEIGDLLVPKSLVNNTTPTPNVLWRANRTVILTYANKLMSQTHDYLWPYLTHAWGDKRKSSDLERYLESAMDKFGNQGLFWSAMAELTPKPYDYISKPRFGLRGFAQLVNVPLTYWFHRPQWYSKCMIVSTDFYLGNNIIETCIEVNRHKTP